MLHNLPIPALSVNRYLDFKDVTPFAYNQCYLDHDECAYGYPAIGGNYNYAGNAIYLQHRAGP